MNIHRWLLKALRLFVKSKQQLTHHSQFILLRALKTTFRLSNNIVPLMALVLFGLVIYDAGYISLYSSDTALLRILHGTLAMAALLVFVRLVAGIVERTTLRAHLFELLQFIILLVMVYLAYRQKKDFNHDQEHFIWEKVAVYGGAVFFFLTEVSQVMRFVYQRSIQPTFIFVTSFASLIAFGTLLLKLPNATTHGISLVDALFTSTSAICVTGLAVVDTATAFTTLGKTIIMALIQVGGLGIMVFSAVLTYLATGAVSFQNQLALKDVLSANQIGNVLQLVMRVIVVTFFFELAGMAFIFWSLPDGLFNRFSDKLFFSAFHAVSAFCNAGFSTFTNGLYENPIRFDYNLHLVVAFLIILGGIGFPIIFNVFSYFRIKTVNVVRLAIGEKPMESRAHIINVNSKIALVTTSILLLFGFLAYFFFEQEATLQQHPTLWGKIATSFFGSVTPRTAGFNTVDLTAMAMPTVMVYLLLMWIGASPNSTGGGIKTTAAAISFLNIGTIIQGKQRTEIFRKQVTEGSVHRALAIVFSSLLVIALAVLVMSCYDADKGMVKIIFEVFSAFGTVGLTLGITPALTSVSKVVLVIVMYIGRVGFITLLMAFVHQVKSQGYQYPQEEIGF